MGTCGNPWKHHTPTCVGMVFMGTSMGFQKKTWGSCHALIFWLREPMGLPQESDMQIRKSLKGDDYFKWCKPLTAIVENHGECTTPFRNLHNTMYSNS